jgi:hypothetical protein
MMVCRLGTEATIFTAIATACINDGTEVKSIAHEMTANVIGKADQGCRISAQGKTEGGFPIKIFPI